MTRGKSHISEDEFRRYLENEMTENERNTFEKKLQKDPFTAEAVEGFESVSLADIKNDLTELKEKIHPQERKNRSRYFAAAATILLVVTAGIIWIQFNSQNPVPELAEKSEDRSRKTEDRSQKLEETKIPGKEQFQLSEEKLITKEKTEREKDDEAKYQTIVSTQLDPAAASAKQSIPNPRAEQAEATRQMPDVNSKRQAEQTHKLKTAQNVSFTTDSNILDVGGVKYETQTIEVSSKNRKIRGMVISTDDNQPLPGVTLIEKGTTNEIVSDINGNFELQLLNDSSPTVVASFAGMESAEFQPIQDSVYQIKLEPGDTASNEVVAMDYETQRKKTPTGSVPMVSKKPKNSQPEPVCGMEEYNNYLEDNAILPDNFSREKEVVKLLLKLDHDGEVISIENKNNTELEIFERAKELILNGPDWNPEIKNGENIESQVKLKIVFRKIN